MSYNPTYSYGHHKTDDGLKFSIRWKGRLDPIAICEDRRDAMRICDALNGHADCWIPVSDRKPDEGQRVLVATSAGNWHAVTWRDGYWVAPDGRVGQRIAASTITHWSPVEVPPNENDNKETESCQKN